jgi:hypothetical protein
MASLIPQIAITPEVFEGEFYENGYQFRHAISNLYRGLKATGLIANMGSGKWKEFVESSLINQRPEVLKLIKILAERGRLIDFSTVSKKPLETYDDWLPEAMLLLNKDDIQGVISTLQSTEHMSVVHPIDLEEPFGKSPEWWIDDPTIKLQATVKCRTEEYISVLKPILTNASKVVFYDRFLNPSIKGYSNFYKIIAACSNNKKGKYLKIDIHRTIPHKSDRAAFYSQSEWETQFSTLRKVVETYGLNVSVHIWNPRDLALGKHPRFVISSIGSLTFDHGFSEENESNIISFLGRKESLRWETNLDINHNRPAYIFKI